MASPARRHSCETAAETLEWMNAIADFIRLYKPLIDAHVVNFFKDKLWELVDEQWMECLKEEPVENLLAIPSGFVQEYWPASLQEFILTVRSLSLLRERESFHTVFPNLHVASFGSVLSQGMNSKKRHEVEILAAVVNAIAREVDAQTVVDVGSGQGYLAQALSFEYQLSVIAIDASMHHSSVTAARAERIRKHYAAKLRKSACENLHLKVPQVVTCQVLSSDTLTALSTSSYKINVEQNDSHGGLVSERNAISPCDNCYSVSSLVLAGLHACGDLSVSMLRTFVDCEQVKALVGIGCCYNLLSEESSQNSGSACGFPMSNAAKHSILSLGKNARDLACQSAERWRNLTKDAALQNFELHAFRAAFQLVLDKNYQGVLTSSPSIGRQGKALRRQQLRRSIEFLLGAKGTEFPPSNSNDGTCTISSQSKLHSALQCEKVPSFRTSDNFLSFKKFSDMGLSHLNLVHLQDMELLEIWKEAEPFFELVGPYWSLRAALGQLVETYILLDRLLFLQERGDLAKAFLLPIFDPAISPRNVAIIARKTALGV